MNTRRGNEKRIVEEGEGGRGRGVKKLTYLGSGVL